jgi:hypothetical protein
MAVTLFGLSIRRQRFPAGQSPAASVSVRRRKYFGESLKILFGSARRRDSPAGPARRSPVPFEGWGRFINTQEHAMRNQIIGWLAVLFGSAGLAPVNAGNITSDLVAFTSSETRDSGPINLFSFGTTSAGGFNTTGAHDNAQTAWFQDHFGMYGRTSMNSTGEGQGGFDIAHSFLQESMLIPPQQGMAQGDSGTFHLSYHLDGTVNIDVGVTLAPGSEQVVSFGRVFYGWGFFAGDVGAPLVNIGVAQNTWLGNQISDVVDRDVDVPIPFQFGVPFYYATEFRLEVGAGSTFAPSTGFAEGDFLHTGTLLGGAVFDQFGDRLSNPLVISDSGFDYVNPQAESAVPEPSTLVMSSIVFGVFGVVWLFRWHELNGRSARIRAASQTTRRG